jgi:plastocyanin
MHVAVGQIVVWTNEDDTGHTVRAIGARRPRSGLIPAGGRFEHTALEPGRLRYGCVVHPQMRAELIVRRR